MVDDGSEGTNRPMTRSQGRPRLRDIRQPPGSHSNKFEREFQQDTGESFHARQSHVMVDNKNKDEKVRSAHSSRWMNSKKAKSRV